MPLNFRHNSKVAIASAVCLPFIFGCGRTINRTAESRIREVLPEYLGAAKSWSAHVDSPPLNTLNGKLRNLTIDGEQVNLQETIRCAKLHIEMKDVVFDTEDRRLKSVKETKFSAVIDEVGLNRYLRENPPPEEEPVRVKFIELRPEKMYVEGTRWLLGKAWNYNMTVEPTLSTSTHLDFPPDRMNVTGISVPLPKSALRWLAKRLSQGFDFSTLPFTVRLSKFKVEQGRIFLEGEADVMESLNRRIGGWLGRSPAQNICNDEKSTRPIDLDL